MGLGKTLSSAAIGAALAVTLTGHVQAQAPRTDADIATVLETHDDALIGQRLTYGVENIVEKIAATYTDRKGAGGSKFRVVELTKDGRFKKAKTETHPQYGNPVGVLHPGFYDFDTEGKFYLTTFAAEALERYETDFARFRKVASGQGIGAGRLDQFRLDTRPQTIGGQPVGTTSVIRTTVPLGAVREGMIIDLRGEEILGKPSARIIFTFQPEGKQPLRCAGVLPFDTIAGKRTYLPTRAGLLCDFGDSARQVLTTWQENAIDTARHAPAQRPRPSGFCGAACGGIGDVPDMLGGGIDSLFGGPRPSSDR